MLDMKLRDLATTVGGSLCDADPDAVVTGPVRYDTRLVGPGGLFAAFAGINVDGHDFAAQAVARGGTLSVVGGGDSVAADRAKPRSPAGTARWRAPIRRSAPPCRRRARRHGGAGRAPGRPGVPAS